MSLDKAELPKIYEVLENLSSYHILLIRRKDTLSKKNNNIDTVTVFLKISTSDIEDALQ